MKSENPGYRYELRPATAGERELFYAMEPEKDAELGCIGHVRIDFGHRGDGFYHTWHPRGPEEWNTQDFKDELSKVVDQMRGEVLSSLGAMEKYCHGHGGEISGGWVQNYGYIVETERYRYCLRCNPVQGDYQAYLTCFDKRVQELSQAAQDQQTEGKWDLKITDFLGKMHTLKAKVDLYTVTDFMGDEMPGLALDLYEVDEETGELEPYATLTKCFGEFISVRDSAYIDTNNCYFADQLLKQGIAEQTSLTKRSGFCEYPLWVFKKEFLEAVGGEHYQTYANAYDQYDPLGLGKEEQAEGEEEITPPQVPSEAPTAPPGPVLGDM